MLNKRFKYNNRIAITREDLDYIKSLRIDEHNRKSFAGILSFIINKYKKDEKMQRK